MGLIGLLVGLGLFLILIWSLAIYALPAFVGIWAGLWALNHGAGLGAIFLGIAVAMAIFLAGRLGLRSVNAGVRLAVLALFIFPAAWAGYSVVQELSQNGIIPSPAWRQVFGAIGAMLVAITTFRRLVEPIGFAGATLTEAPRSKP